MYGIMAGNTRPVRLAAAQTIKGFHFPRSRHSTGPRTCNLDGACLHELLCDCCDKSRVGSPVHYNNRIMRPKDNSAMGSLARAAEQVSPAKWMLDL